MINAYFNLPALLYLKYKFYRWIHYIDNPLKIGQPKKRIFVFLAADYGNLGDVAITYAQEKFLEENFPGYEIIDVPISLTLRSLGQIKRAIKDDDIITVTGGGNMGSLYSDIELLRLMIVSIFRKHRIVIFPQTFINSGDDDSLFLHKKQINTYNKARDLVIAARDMKSFDLMKESFCKTKILLIPDIVLGMNIETEKNFNSDKILFCLRNDLEKKDHQEIINKIKYLCASRQYHLIERDTHIGRNKLTVTERKDEFFALLNVFLQSKLVITDRLHGMIFSYITKTPAIVLSNNNFKISEGYKWLEGSDFIKLADKSSDINKVLDHLLDLNPDDIKINNFESYYNQLIN